MLAAVEANTDGDYELILVDNGTGYEVDDPHVTVLRNEENQGFARGSNMGALAARGNIVVMLNVDTEPQPGWIVPLLLAFEDPQVAVAGPRLIYPDGRLQCAGIRTWHGGGNAGGENRRDEHPSNSDEDGVTGACLAVRTAVFSELGGFDEQYWNGYEDVDLCLRVKEAGHKIAYVAESVVVHHESATGPERWSRTHDNVARMNACWGDR